MSVNDMSEVQINEAVLERAKEILLKELNTSTQYTGNTLIASAILVANDRLCLKLDEVLCKLESIDQSIGAGGPFTV